MHELEHPSFSPLHVYYQILALSTKPRSFSWLLSEVRVDPKLGEEELLNLLGQLSNQFGINLHTFIPSSYVAEHGVVSAVAAMLQLGFTQAEVAMIFVDVEQGKQTYYYIARESIVEA